MTYATNLIGARYDKKSTKNTEKGATISTQQNKNRIKRQRLLHVKSALTSLVCALITYTDERANGC